MPTRLCRPLATSLVLLTALASTGCGLIIAALSGLAIAGISDAIKGKKKKGGESSVLVVRNDLTSTDSIVEVDVVPVSHATPPSTNVVGIGPGAAATFTDVYDAGAHWVRVKYLSGWRSRVKRVDVVGTGTVEVVFAHPPPDSAALAGTWFGAVESPLGAGHSYGVTLSVAGTASGRTVDGTPDAATGTLTETSEGVFRVVWSDATVIALVADVVTGATHAAFVGDDGTAGVLERSATTLAPPAVDGEVVGSWTGVQVRFDSLVLDPVDVDAASATVSVAQGWDGLDGRGEATSSVTALVVSNAAFLRYFADAVAGGAPLDLGVGLTPDRTAMAVALVPASGAAFPDDFTFQVLRKDP